MIARAKRSACFSGHIGCCVRQSKDDIRKPTVILGASMRSLMALTAMLGALVVFGCSAARAGSVPVTSQWAQARLDALLAGPTYRDQQVYAAMQAELSKKVKEAAQFPERAEAIARELFFEMIKSSPIAPGYTPENNARTAAALEAYIAVLNNATSNRNTPAASQPSESNPAGTAKILPPFSDSYGSAAVNEILHEATTGSFIDKFFPADPSANTSIVSNAAPGGARQQQVRPPMANPAGRSSPNQSTITGLGEAGGNPQLTSPGLSGTYRPITRDRASEIVKTYKSIPGGFTLEGSSPDFSFVRSAVYEPAANAIILNNDVVYLSPVSASELREILRALASDDRLGVSLSGASAAIIYGQLAPYGDVAMNLKMVDRFLGAIAFGNTQYLAGYRFARGYQARQPSTDTGVIFVYFNCKDFRFDEDLSGALTRSTAKMEITLVPTSDKGEEGYAIPDFNRINRGDMPKEYIENAKHIQDNLEYYARERIVRTAFSYGEIAAFARAIKAQGGNLEQLAHSIVPLP
jgi:hypothetical protein